MTAKQISPDQINQRPSISLPYLKDRAILASIMNRDGISLSAAIRITIREYERSHCLLAAPATPSTTPPIRQDDPPGPAGGREAALRKAPN